MHMLVLAVGRADAVLDPLCNGYLKRLRTPFRGSMELCKSLAAAQARAHKQRSVHVALDERGSALTTAAFTEKLQTWCAAAPLVSFTIGDDTGIPTLDAFDATLSLSTMTFPHRLARLVLCEQLYRASTLATGHPYHRDA